MDEIHTLAAEPKEGAGTGAARAARRLGIADMLLKPIDKQQLLHSIERVLTREKRLSERIGNILEHEISQLLRPVLPERFAQHQLRMASRHPHAVDYLAEVVG